MSTDANHFFILDFVLFLEYIGATSDEINIPQFTRGGRGWSSRDDAKVSGPALLA